MTAHRSSKVAVRSRLVQLVPGFFYGGYDQSWATRSTEKEGLDLYHGHGQPNATDNTAKLRNYKDLLKCSNSKCHAPYQHFEDFDKCRSYPWRADGRAYYCKTCAAAKREELKRQGIQSIVDAADEAYLRSKPNNRRIPKKLDIRASTA